jgi:hypothetical protein
VIVSDIGAYVDGLRTRLPGSCCAEGSKLAATALRSVVCISKCPSVPTIARQSLPRRILSESSRARLA